MKRLLSKGEWGYLKLKTLSTTFMLFLLSVAAFIPVMGQPEETDNGATLTVDVAEVHVVWKLRIHIAGGGTMTEKVDDLIVCYQFNDNRALETQLKDLIENAVAEKLGEGYSVSCENLKLVLDWVSGEYADVDLQFDLKGLAKTEGEDALVNLAWRSMKVKGYVRVSSDGKEAKFEPYISLALNWGGFDAPLDRWDSEKEEGYTIYTYRQKRPQPILSDYSLNDLEMVIATKGDTEARGDYIVFPGTKVTETAPSGFVLPSIALFTPTNLMILAAIVVAGVAFLGWRYVSASRKKERFRRRAFARREVTEFAKALDQWEAQKENRRLPRRIGWRGGNASVTVPRMHFSNEIRDYYYGEYARED